MRIFFVGFFRERRKKKQSLPRNTRRRQLQKTFFYTTLFVLILIDNSSGFSNETVACVELAMCIPRLDPVISGRRDLPNGLILKKGDAVDFMLWAIFEGIGRLKSSHVSVEKISSSLPWLLSKVDGRQDDRDSTFGRIKRQLILSLIVR